MSVKLMSAIFETEFHSLKFTKSIEHKDGTKEEVSIDTRACTAKLVLLALADHANDYGESVYPSLTRLEKKTGLSRNSLIDTLEALKFYGLLTVSEVPSRLGTNNYTINIMAYPVYIREKDENFASEATALVIPGSEATAPALARPPRQASEATAPESSLTINESSTPASKEKRTPHVPEGFPEPTGDIVSDWEKAKRVGDQRAAPYKSVLEGLSKLNPNWPKYGENKEWDRVARLIVDATKKGTGTVDGFVKWVNSQKDRPQRIQWYGRKPNNVWEDWPLAFEKTNEYSREKSFPL